MGFKKQEINAPGQSTYQIHHFHQKCIIFATWKLSILGLLLPIALSFELTLTHEVIKKGMPIWWAYQGKGRSFGSKKPRPLLLTNQVRTITPLQSGSTLYKCAKLTGAQYKHRYVNTCWMSIIEFYLHWMII